MTRPIWPLYLVLPFKYGRLVTALVIFVVAYAFFSRAPTTASGFTTPSLFFSAVLAYIIPVFSLITEHCRQALTELRPQLDISDADFEQLHDEIGGSSLKHTAFFALLGLAGGTAHLILLLQSATDGILPYLQQSPGALIGWIGTLLVWLTITTVMASLIDTAIRFARLGAETCRVDLLNTQPLIGFARVAIISSLAIIGAQALFSLMSIDSSISMKSALPGLIGMGIPLLALFAVPIWPVHKRLSATKTHALAQLNQRIEQCRDGATLGDESVAVMTQINQLLMLRREVLLAPVWPFDAGAITRLVLYIIIVPLTWAGAALIEMLLENVV
ncbi:hypothetical protein EYC98_06055 [Halieaceae bacterium IMCC14734]|uniref:Uncharacterized protein n=1 Tax=Candidatus Litorirhabdus singularis TaxID=2518993 RepID=A0ABT3TF41_9GAMM|nr:hypothetical protein [Candidatus Litorirhabdus singularis]MCX2980435.1 hypothetical protein [Candidatus Litorirhabdus singularis]